MGILEELQEEIRKLREENTDLKKKIITLERNYTYDIGFVNSQIDMLANILGVNLDERILQRSGDDGEIEADNLIQ